MKVVKLTDREAETVVRLVAIAWALAACRAATPEDTYPHWSGDNQPVQRREKIADQAALAQSLKCSLCAFGVTAPAVNQAWFLIPRLNGGFFCNVARRDEERERLVTAILYSFRKFGVTEMPASAGEL